LDPSADVDAILQVTHVGHGVVKGVWFSRLFGRVGDFELLKDKIPSLPPGAQTMEIVSGHYAGPEWELDVLVSLSTAEPNSENPFAPLTFDGWAMIPATTGKKEIAGGSFDFYTGRIAFQVGENAWHVGQRPSRSSLLLKRTHQGVLSPVPPFPLVVHPLTGNVTGRFQDFARSNIIINGGEGQ